MGVIGQPLYRRLPLAEWKVFLPDAHPGYLSWEEFETNQATLRANAQSRGLDRRRSPAREGVALLQGLVLCGRCGERMTVRYIVRRGHPAPYYVCQRQGIATAQRICESLPGATLDDAVAETVLAAMTPAALEIALEVFEELRARKTEVDRLRRAQVERAREEAELAQRQFLLVRPEHRLVADSLERQWNEALLRLAAAEEEYRRATTADAPALTGEDRARIHALASDLPRVWHDPRTAMRERKRMLRLLVDDVTLVRERRTIHLHLRWKGGATTSLDRPMPRTAWEARKTPAAIVEKIRALAGEQTDTQMAATLNGDSLRSGTGQPFSRLVIRHIRQTYGIPGMAEHLHHAGWLTASEMAGQLGVHFTTAKRFAHEGLLRAVRADGRGRLLFAPPTGPLPRAQQGKRYGDRRRRCPPVCATDAERGAV